MNAEGASDLPQATGIVDAESPQAAYELVKNAPNHTPEMMQNIEYILSEDGNTIYFHPKVGWLPEPLVKYDRPKAS